MLFESLCNEAAEETRKHLDEIRRTEALDHDISPAEVEINSVYAEEVMIRCAYAAMKRLNLGDLEILFEESPAIRSGCYAAIREAINQAIVGKIAGAAMEFSETDHSPQGNEEDQQSTPSFRFR
ncbi:hypothetical protein FF80_02517 [Devosia sp. LC5]|uniref:hypothetical protein n=1 Tax=Devosia sp. LC5 TaxID=1502724 RepID=UPI0004E2E01E|nr:hypothetical protein [Devosia sp. LC5]KFC66256.1 hypothetical protein FF80_02517 [Devosia sp. LC5]